MTKPYEVLKVGGSEIHLKITTAHAVKLEEELGTDILSGLEKLAEINLHLDMKFSEELTNAIQAEADRAKAVKKEEA